MTELGFAPRPLDSGLCVTFLPPHRALRGWEKLPVAPTEKESSPPTHPTPGCWAGVAASPALCPPSPQGHLTTDIRGVGAQPGMQR